MQSLQDVNRNVSADFKGFVSGEKSVPEGNIWGVLKKHSVSL